MLPLAVSVFITQIVGLLGAAAAAKLVILIAYHLKDLDIRLMYHENITRHLGFYKDYNTSDSRRGLVIWMSLIALLISFLPTYLSFGADTRDIEHVTYTNIHTSKSLTDLGPSVEDKTDEPLFTEFYNTSTHTSANSTGGLLQNYIISRKKETQINPSGVWYNVPADYFSPGQQMQRWNTSVAYRMNPQTLNDTTGVFFTTDGDKDLHAYPYRPKQNELKKTYAISYNNNNKVNTQGSSSSSTLENCAINDALDSNLVLNLTLIDGHQVQGAHSMNRTCYPITDPSVWLTSFQESDNDTGIDSLLNSNEDIYFRPTSLNPQSSASYSMGIVARNWRKNNIVVVMVKKSAHITVFYSDLNRSLTPADSCISSSSLVNPNKTTFYQDINSIVCQLIAQAKQNPELPILQATRRFYSINKLINSVYTYIKKDNGHGIMIDLTLYSAYSARGFTSSSLDSEIFIAYQQVKKYDFDTTDFEQLLQSINPFPDLDTEYGLYTATDLVHIGLRILDLSLSKNTFIKTTAHISAYVRVSTLWIALTASLAVIFILIISMSHVMTPEAYKTDLRSLLIHTLISHDNRSDSSSNNSSPMRGSQATCLFTRAVHLEAEKLLRMDGNPIILSENIPMVDQTRANSSA